VQVGDKIPEAVLYHSTNPEVVDACAIPSKINTAEFFKGKKVVIFAVPAAFSPTCSDNHLPGFISNLDVLKEKGVDAVMCLSADTVWALDAWGKKIGVGRNIVSF
ncbi:thioredoxin-like protein, partial [Blyttiomyces helicus]